MPRSGPPSYTYTLPPIYIAVPGTTITAAQHNDPLEDIADTFNSVLPEVWGGTGSANASGARTNLGLEIGTDVAGIAFANVFTQPQTVRLSDDAATAGPRLTLDRLSASPAAADLLGELLFSGRDSGAATQTYALIGAAIVDPVAATEDGRLLLQTVIAGALANRLFIGAGVYTPNATGGDKGVDTVNSKGYYVDNVQVHPGIMADTTPGAAQAATQAEQETATSTARVVTPARQQFHPSASKAWGKTTGGGTPVLSTSYNITSITDGGTGLLTVTIANDFSSANYAVSVTPLTTASGENRIANVFSQAAGSFGIYCASDSGAAANPSSGYSWICFGDLP